MEYRSSLRDAKSRALIFGLLPCAVGLAGALYMHLADAIWLTTAGSFWPIVLSTISASILIKLAVSPFQDRTSAVAAWLTLAWTWFYFPLWATAREVPYAAAVIGRDGRVNLASQVTRDPALKIWFMTDHSGTRTVHNVVGKV